MFIGKNCKEQEFNYDNYEGTKKELLLAYFQNAALVCFFSYFFYQTFWAVFPLSALFILLLKRWKKQKITARKEQLANQFKDCIHSVATNLKAGYSVENAFRESIPDIKRLYGEQADMVRELNCIVQGIQNNISLEKLLISFGKRSHIVDISEFGEVFSIAKRNGGNMTEILGKTTKIMEQKLEIDREITILLSAKKMEQKIMNLIPFGIVLYISITSPDFFLPLYHNLGGISIMTICLIIYLAAFALSEKIVDIEIH